MAFVRRLQAGEAAAWEELYLRHHDALLFAIRCRLGGGLREQLTSEDVFQSVVADAFTDIRRFEPRGPGSLQRWLSACVLNKLRSKAQHFTAAKRAGATPLTDSLAERANAGPHYFEPQGWEALERGLGELDEGAREVVLLRTLEGLSNEEVAARTGRTASATSKLYNRALARLGARIAALRGADGG